MAPSLVDYTQGSQDDLEREKTNALYLCLGAVNTLAVKEERYFKPSPSAFIRVAERGPDAWQIRPGSYFLLPFKEAFGQQIPKDYTIFLTIKPAEESEVMINDWPRLQQQQIYCQMIKMYYNLLR